jgi:hypothetical protein
MDDPARFACHLHIPPILVEAATLDGVLDELVRAHLDGMRWKDFSDDDELYGGSLEA